MAFDLPVTTAATAGLLSSAVCAVALVSLRLSRRRLPTVVAPLLAVAVASPWAEVPPRRFLTGSAWSYPVGPAAALAAGLAVFVVATTRVGADDGQRRWATAAAAAVSLGAFSCVPETGLLAVVPGPLLVTALAVLAFPPLAPPLGPVAVTAFGAIVAELALTGGSTRPSCLLGVASALAVASLLLAGPFRRPTARPAGRLPGRRADATARGAVAVIAVAVARIGGTTESGTVAAVVLGVSLAAAGLGLRWGRSGSGAA